MTNRSELFLSDGQSYQLGLSPKEAANKLMNADGETKQELQSFHTGNGKEIFVNPLHVVLITEYHSPEDAPQSPSADQQSGKGDEERKSHNLKEMEKFKEEIDDMK